MATATQRKTPEPVRSRTREYEDLPLPQSEICHACGAPMEPGDKFCNACGTAQGRPEVVTVAAEAKHFRCENCGAEVQTDPNQRSYVCPFCDSTYVVEFSRNESDRQRPEFVIGFRITPQQAEEKFRAWLGQGGWFRPGDLKTAQMAEKLKGVYLPFWSFSMLAQSGWSASIGEYWYRTETYTTIEDGKPVTKTRTVRETEWWPLAGRHHRYYSGYLVSGSRGLAQGQADLIKPFRLASLQRYEPFYLAGWLAEEYSIAREEALNVCERFFLNEERRNVAEFMPGDTHQELKVQTEFSHVNSDLILLPIYVVSYRYGDQVYRYLLNGQTGKEAGDRPYSSTRIGLAVAAALLVVLILFAIFYFTQR